MLKPNPAYQKVFGVPYVDRVNVALLEQAPARLQAFIGKSLSNYSASAGDLAAAQKGRPDAKAKLDDYAATSTSALFMNSSQAPWNDVRARRALSMAVDRDGWGNTINTQYKLESGPITWGYPTWKLDVAKMPAESTKWLKYDVAEAKKLIDAVGVEPGKVFDINMYPYGAVYTAESQLMQDSLAKIGIESKIKVFEYNNWATTAYIGDYDGLLYGPDNLDRVTQQFADRLLKNSHRNHSLIQDEETQQLISQFSGAKGPEDAKAPSDKIQIRSVDQAFAVYKPQGVALRLWDPALQNYNGEAALFYQDVYQKAFMWNA